MTDRRLKFLAGSPQRRYADLAWAAGYADGEGLIRLEHGSIVFRVWNTHKASLLRLQDLFGGSVRQRKMPSECRPVWCWSLCGAKARAALELLRPLLFEKGAQVDLVLSVHPVRNRPLTDEEVYYREWVVRELARLKKAVSAGSKEGTARPYELSGRLPRARRVA